MDANQNTRLLIIEDHAATRLALGQVFVHQGGTVRSATAVAEALDLLDSGPEPDALILDLMLPDGDGLDVLRQVRYAGLRTHVAVCTGTSDPMLMMRVRALSPDILRALPPVRRLVAPRPIGRGGPGRRRQNPNGSIPASPERPRQPFTQLIRSRRSGR